MRLFSFILTNKFAENPDREDSAAILRAMSIKKYVAQAGSANIMCCIQLARPENCKHFEQHAFTDVGGLDHIICTDELKMSLLAKSCVV
jgi:hypothetical protein